LPPDHNEQDDDDSDGPLADPRAELVKRLLEYQKYKEIARHLGDQDTLDRDVFERGEPAPQPEGDAKLAQGNVFRLFDAFERVLKHAEQTASHDILFERVNIADRIVELTELLQEHDKLRFEDLFISPTGTTSAWPPRIELVTTFLALLEMGKMRIIRIAQEDSFGELWLRFAPQRLDGDDLPPPDEGSPDNDSPRQNADDTPAETAGHDPGGAPPEEQGQSDAP
jgi:segregation and condensation protein A